MDPDSDPGHWLLETKTKIAIFQETKKKHSEKDFPFSQESDSGHDGADPLVQGTDPDPAPDSSITKQK